MLHQIATAIALGLSATFVAWLWGWSWRADAHFWQDAHKVLAKRHRTQLEEMTLLRERIADLEAERTFRRVIG